MVGARAIYAGGPAKGGGGMRSPRIKETCGGYYHIISRIVDRQRVHDQDEMLYVHGAQRGLVKVDLLASMRQPSRPSRAVTRMGSPFRKAPCPLAAVKHSSVIGL